MKTTTKNSLKLKKQKTPKYAIVKNLKNLKALIANGYFEFLITLNGGIFSRKNIDYIKSTRKFESLNWIDDTEQTLTEKQLMNPNWTNIGLAIKKKALIVNLEKIKQ